jgi:hypothetical protein
MSSKMEVLKQEASRFVRELHLEGLHWGCVNSFNSSVNIGEMTTNESEILSQIDRLRSDGNTALFRSISDSISTLCERHHKAGREGVPMMVLTFTDGINNEGSSVANVRKSIEEYNFFPDNNCFFAIAGVGQASESVLQDICKESYGLYTHTDKIEEVFTLFKQVVLQIAIQVGTRFQSISTENLHHERLEAFAQTFGAIFPIDYVLNLDRSYSMSESTSGASRGGCFISTAVASSMGLPDDCDMLQTLRQFRDEILLGRMELNGLVEQYYSISPTIIERMDKNHQQRSWHQWVCREYIQPAVDDIKRGRYEQALHKYCSMVEHLAQQCGIKNYKDL